MKKLPISIQTFEDIITGGMIYVDKTAFIWELAQAGKFYFLSRPRRFGKSLLLTTLRSYFQGRKDLFEGLYIFDKEKEWKKHPVVHIDYSLLEYKKSR
ncbi:MAG: AAA family ATPase, partial [Phaeodactylibacter sp.]|nr:AAA family ATPase [Phaeodactylibacter sp.]